MPSVLCLVSHYLPGYKAGGALRSVANLVQSLGDKWQFDVVTSDRDLGDRAPYAGVRPGAWTTLGPARVWYSARALRDVVATVRSTRADLLYLNSFFDVRFATAALLAARSRRDRRLPVVLAPRGEFSAGALQQKRLKKRVYLAWAKRAALYRGIVWHASTPLEAAEIRRGLGDVASDVRIVPDLVAGTPRPCSDDPPPPGRDPLRLVFVSRLSPKKNLPFALRALRSVGAQIEFDVYGPEEDAAHAAECRRAAAELPANVRVRFHGAIEHGEVPRVLGRSHLFFFPTLGENFGHVIAEALNAGTPVLVSDQTPWRGLEREGAGWDLPLHDPTRFAIAIDTVATMDDARYASMRAAARRLAAAASPAPNEEQLAQLFFAPADADLRKRPELPSDAPRNTAKS